MACGNYNEHMRNALAKMTRDDVNRVIRQHLRTNRLVIVGRNKERRAA